MSTSGRCCSNLRKEYQGHQLQVGRIGSIPGFAVEETEVGINSNPSGGGGHCDPLDISHKI